MPLWPPGGQALVITYWGLASAPASNATGARLSAIPMWQWRLAVSPELGRSASATRRPCGRHRAGDRIRIGGLGTLEVPLREARTGRNPATGETMQIAASKKVAFRPAKELKEAV